MIRSLSILLLVMLAGSLGVLSAQHEESEKSARPAFTQTQAEQWLEEVLPVLEKVSGRQLAPPLPTVECVGQAALAKVLTSEFLDALNRLTPDDKDSTNAILAQAQGAQMAQAMLGKYSLKQKKLLLVPSNFTRIMDLADIPPEQLEPLVKLTIAHELGHRLQDQEIDLAAALGTITELEPMQSFNASMEGQAIVFHEMVGDELGLEVAVATLNYLMPGGGFMQDKFPNLENAKTPPPIYHKINYDYGGAYMRKLYQAGGPDATWDAMAKAPVDLNIILTARAVSHEGKSYMERLQGIEQLFDGGKWQVKQVALDQQGVRSQFNHLPKDLRNKMLAAVTSSSSIIAGQQSQRIVVFSLMTLSDPKYVAAVQEFMANSIAEKITTFRRQGIQFKQNERNIELPNDVTVFETTLEITIPQTGESADQYLCLMQKGDVIVQILLFGVPKPDDAKYQQIADRIFDH
ncbi:hypothetical protein [Cerasicoccus arenae]|uniref:Peptidase M48 domain-containing protein n=1 Tax=Cerasicoccus arenae TaxID=424488 RepID=A0A8J3DHK3_9BACT|nr:hypothetical protein [Cerasicoccus arenae]MBK1859180.1 hypothetical protein [Cerasicoccus arenae]GHC01104.1 hypothetical protein GCM10007047_16900 [Cerasicoccus arenae]